MNDTPLLLQAIDSAAATYHRLALVIGLNESETSQAMLAVSAALGAPLINLNRDLSEVLLDVPHRQRPLRAHKAVGDIVDEVFGDVVLFDHIDILFNPSLRLDALALLKGLSRNRTIAAAWPGTARGGRLLHAEEWHPEYQNHPIEDIKVVQLGG